MPEPVSLTAYRVIQESLTNTLQARRDTARPWTCRLGYAPGTLRVAIDNEGVARPPADGPRAAGARHASGCGNG